MRRNLTQEEWKLATIYRLVYGEVCRALEAYYRVHDRDRIRAGWRGYLARLKEDQRDDPQMVEAVKAAVEDATDGKRPRW